MEGLRVLSVGQCGFDHGQISRSLLRDFDAQTTGADTHEEALALLEAGGFHLVLVNRIGDADGRPGVDLVRAIKADSRLAEIPVMLVSNHEEAQAEAVAAGAEPGFGKSDLGRDRAYKAVDRALAHLS